MKRAQLATNSPHIAAQHLARLAGKARNQLAPNIDTLRGFRDASPKYLVCDKDSIFWCEGFKSWCRRKGIRPRFGAAGKHGSIAVVERFIRTMKDEGIRRILVPHRRTGLLRDLSHRHEHTAPSPSWPSSRLLIGCLAPKHRLASRGASSCERSCICVYAAANTASPWVSAVLFGHTV